MEKEKQINNGKEYAILDKLAEVENFFPKDKPNAIEKILAKESIIKEEIEQKLGDVIGKNIMISKGVVTRRKNGKLEGSGDCDLIIFYKKLLDNAKGKKFGEVVSVPAYKKSVKVIISIETALRNLNIKSKSGKYTRFEALKKQKNYCNNVIALFLKDKSDKNYNNNKLKKGQAELKKKIKNLEKNGIKIIVLESNNDFKKLITKLKNIF